MRRKAASAVCNQVLVDVSDVFCRGNVLYSSYSNAWIIEQLSLIEHLIVGMVRASIFGRILIVGLFESLLLEPHLAPFQMLLSF